MPDLQHVIAKIAESLTASAVDTDSAAVLTARVLLAVVAGLQAVLSDTDRDSTAATEAGQAIASISIALDRIGTRELGVLLDMLYPIAGAKGRSLAELSLMQERFARGLDTKLVITIRPGETFPVDVVGLGTFTIAPTALSANVSL